MGEGIEVSTVADSVGMGAGTGDRQDDEISLFHFLSSFFHSPPYRRSVQSIHPLLAEYSKIKMSGRVTPTQEKCRFGYFRCSQCGHKWTSCSAWSDCSQKCKRCRSDVKPHSLKELEAGAEVTIRPPHRRDMCEMCRRIGRDCSQL